MTPDEFIAAVGPAARSSAAVSKIPASFVIAEGALESGWGGSQLCTEAFNLFGVKADPSWTGPIFILRTREYLDGHWTIEQAKWRKYTDWLGSIQDHASFLLSNPRYQPAFAYTSGTTFAMAIAAAGYATDPQYGQKIVSIIKAHNLSSLDT
jgi:flagellum-specific peptidoglycan hydrolase FlgJ